MMFDRITYVGPAFDDAALMTELPSPLAALLVEENGTIAFGGGLHIRGACLTPAWHSLRAAWKGQESVMSRYPAVLAGDVPFAQDALGDQFLLRDNTVLRLSGETGELLSIADSLEHFLVEVGRDPVGFLSLEPLILFERSGGQLAPGQLLNVYPPFCTRHEGEYSYRSILAADRLAFLASLAAQVRSMPDGTPVRFEITDRAV
jgi:hypothetical protein